MAARIEDSSGDGGGEAVDVDRRAALRALARYSGAVGGATLVVLSAEDAVAKQPCSTHPTPQPGQNCIP